MKKILSFTGVFALLLFFIGAQQADAYTHTVTLRMGARSTQVYELQRTLNANGYIVSSVGAGAPGMETTYFGTKTRSAVIAFQAAQGLIADGIVGPMTGGRLATLGTGPVVNLPPGCLSTAGFSTLTGQPCSGGASLPAGCTTIIGYSPLTGVKCDSAVTNPSPSGPLSGSNGEIEDFTVLSQYSDEEVGEGEDDARIAGFEIESSNGGDIAIRSIGLEFDSSGNSGSDDFDDYIESVSIWSENTRVATIDADDFSEDDDIFSRTATLNSSAVIRADRTQRFYISVNAAGNLDSSDISGDSWSVKVDSVRYEDGLGVITTDDDTGDLGSMDVAFDFVTFSNAADTELNFSLATDNPEEGVITVNDDGNTDEQVLLRGEIELEGDSDVNIEEIPVTVTVSGTASDVDAVISNLTLVLGNEEYTENLSTSGTSATVTFDNLDYDLEAGDTIDFEILADINEVDSGTFDEGDTVTVSITSGNVDNVEAENEEGDELTDNELSGSASGNTMQLRTGGIDLEFVSSSTTISSGGSSDDDLGTFRVRFNVEAFGDDVYVSSLATAAGLGYVVDKAGTTVSSGVSAILTEVTNADMTASGNYHIEEGESETFELVVAVQLPTAGTAGLYRMSLTGFKWDTEDDVTPDNTYSFNLDSFKTQYVTLN